MKSFTTILVLFLFILGPNLSYAGVKYIKPDSVGGYNTDEGHYYSDNSGGYVTSNGKYIKPDSVGGYNTDEGHYYSDGSGGYVMSNGKYIKPDSVGGYNTDEGHYYSDGSGGYYNYNSVDSDDDDLDE